MVRAALMETVVSGGEYRPTNTVDPSGINGQSVYNGTAGTDNVYGGNDLRDAVTYRDYRAAIAMGERPPTHEAESVAPWLVSSPLYFAARGDAGQCGASWRSKRRSCDDEKSRLARYSAR